MEKSAWSDRARAQAAKAVRAVMSERQLEEVMVDFWFNHFNVFAGKGDVRWYVSTSSARRSGRTCSAGSAICCGATAEQPGDALLPRQLAERAARLHGAGGTDPRPQGGAQRELRARADGAAHAGRRRRLHAEGRAAKSRARSPAGRSTSRASGGTFLLPPGDARPRREDRARPARSRPAADARTASRCSRSARAAPVDGAVHRDASWRRRFVSDDAAEGAGRRGRRDLHEHRRRHPRRCARDRDSPEFFATRPRARQGEDAARVRGERGARAGCQHRRARRDAAGAGDAPARHAALPGAAAHGLRGRADAWVNAGALVQPHELRRPARAARQRARRLAGGAPIRASLRVLDRLLAGDADQVEAQTRAVRRRSSPSRVARQTIGDRGPANTDAPRWPRS